MRRSEISRGASWRGVIRSPTPVRRRVVFATGVDIFVVVVVVAMMTMFVAILLFLLLFRDNALLVDFTRFGSRRTRVRSIISVFFIFLLFAFLFLLFVLLFAGGRERPIAYRSFFGRTWEEI